MKLTDVCDFQGGTQPPKEQWTFEEKDGYIRMLQIRDFTQSGRVVPEYIKINKSTKTCEEDDILIARYGASIGKILTGLAGAYNVAIMRTMPDLDRIKKKYLYYYLKSPYFQNAILNVGSRAAQAGFNKDDLSKLDIACPLFSEQDVIVNQLELLESIISKYQNELLLLDDLVKARFVEMFGTKDNNKFNYPTVRLGDYAKLQGGYAFKSKDFVDSGIPLVQIGNVNKDYLDWGVINFVPDEYLNRYSEFLLRDGDLVMAMTRPIIKSLNSVKIAKVSESDGPCLLNQRVGRFVLSDSLNKQFLETICKSNDFKDYVKKMSGNSLQPNISSKQVEDYKIILPPIDLQEKFSVFCQQIDKSKVVVQKALDEAQLLFDSLMQDYFG